MSLSHNINNANDTNGNNNNNNNYDNKHDMNNNNNNSRLIFSCVKLSHLICLERKTKVLIS